MVGAISRYRWCVTPARRNTERIRGTAALLTPGGKGGKADDRFDRRFNRRGTRFDGRATIDADGVDPFVRSVDRTFVRSIENRRRTIITEIARDENNGGK